MTNAEELYASETAEKGMTCGYLRLSIVILGIIALVAVSGCVWAVWAAGQRHAYVVKVEPDGSTDVVVEGFKPGPQPLAAKYFLQKFCEIYFSRNPVSMRYLSQTVWYFAPDMRDTVGETLKQIIKNFTSNGTLPQVEVKAKSVNLANDGTGAFVDLEIIRRGQEDPQKATTFIRFSCLVCDGQHVDSEIISAGDVLGFQIENIPLLQTEK